MSAKTMEEIADESVRVARDLRIGLYDVLGAVNGLSEVNRRHIAPKIEKLLADSAGMPTAFDVVNARAAAHGLKAKKP